ncbi:hypothetical protein MN608_06552 [Microdochium nivale]|nr:hypothetical protein MN608_06552 [Microdochium nivale]
MLGGLIRKLHDQNLWPLPDDGKATTPAAKIGASIKDLATKTETPAPPNPRSFVNSFGGHGSRHVHAGYRDVAPPNLGGFGNSIGSGRSSRVHAGCRGVTPPFETRAEAHDNPWVYSMDYHYQASREESAHMVRQAALSGVY